MISRLFKIMLEKLSLMPIRCFRCKKKIGRRGVSFDYIEKYNIIFSCPDCTESYEKEMKKIGVDPYLKIEISGKELIRLKKEDR